MRVTTYKVEMPLQKIKDSKTKAPIRLRITKDRKVIYRTLIHIEPEHWDLDNKCVKKKHPNAKELNALLENRIAEIKKEVSLLELTDETTCIAGIRNKLSNTTSYDLYKHADKVCETFYKEGQHSSYKKYKSVIAKLRYYTKGDELSIGSVTAKFIRDYEHYLLTVKKNNRNTVNVNLKVIARLVNDIYRENNLNDIKNPFKTKIKIKRVYPNREYLTTDELKRIENLDYRVRSKLYDAQCLFIVECYTGLRISDILTLRWANYNKKTITVRMRKTSNYITIPLTDSVKQIIERRYRIQKKNRGKVESDRYIFNILNVDVNKVSAQDALNAISSATALINRNLKKIAKRAEIEKNISTHIGRHTFATLLISKNVNLFVARDLLGHSDVRVTQEYVKIQNSDKINAINALNNL